MTSVGVDGCHCVLGSSRIASLLREAYTPITDTFLPTGGLYGWPGEREDRPLSLIAGDRRALNMEHKHPV